VFLLPRFIPSLLYPTPTLFLSRLCDALLERLVSGTSSNSKLWSNPKSMQRDWLRVLVGLEDISCGCGKSKRLYVETELMSECIKVTIDQNTK